MKNYIWTPEIVVAECSSKSMYDEIERVMAFVKYDGTVEFWANGVLRIGVSLDLALFPYDE